MFGLEEPPLDVLDIDIRISRMPGEPCWPGYSHIELMRHGLNLTLGGGLRAGDDKSVHQTLTQNPTTELKTTEYALQRARFAHFEKLRQRVPGKLEGAPYRTNSMGILQLFKERSCSLVLIPLVIKRGTRSHYAVVYKVINGAFYLYIPQLRSSGMPLFEQASSGQIDQHLSPTGNIVGVSS
jgi:hypothetical protein